MKYRILRINSLGLFFIWIAIGFCFFPSFSYANLNRETLIKENQAVSECSKDIKCLKRLKNNSQALRQLFYFYAGKDNLELSHKYRKLSSEKGNSISQYYLGFYLYKQNKTKQAKSWLIQSANADYVPSQEVLAYIYFNERKNNTYYKDKQAYYWAYRSSMLGSPKGQKLVAHMLYNGLGVRKNNEKAYMWELIREKESNYSGSDIIVNLRHSLDKNALKRVTHQLKAITTQISTNKTKILNYDMIK